MRSRSRTHFRTVPSKTVLTLCVSVSTLLSGCANYSGSLHPMSLMADGFEAIGGGYVLRESLRPIPCRLEGDFTSYVSYTECSYVGEPSVEEKWFSRIIAAGRNCYTAVDALGNSVFPPEYCVRLSEALKRSEVLEDVQTRTIRYSFAQGVSFDEKGQLDRLLKEIEREAGSYRVRQAVSKSDVESLFRCLPVRASAGKSVVIPTDGECADG